MLRVKSVYDVSVVYLRVGARGGAVGPSKHFIFVFSNIYIHFQHVFFVYFIICIH